MNLLAFDTSTEAFSIATSRDDVVTEEFFVPEQKHTEILLAGIEKALQDSSLSFAELDALVYGRGPGAFTGVRLAVAVAQGLGFSTDLPVVGVSSLAAVAQQVYADTGHRKVIVALDARMSEVYCAAYEFSTAGEAHCVVSEQVCEPGSLAIPDSGGWVSAGTGWSAYAEEFSMAVQDVIELHTEILYPRASAMLALAARDLNDGLATSAAAAVPVYLRNDVAKKSNQK